MKNSKFMLWLVFTALLVSVSVLCTSSSALAMRRQTQQQWGKGSESDEEPEEKLDTGNTQTQDSNWYDILPSIEELEAREIEGEETEKIDERGQSFSSNPSANDFIKALPLGEREKLLKKNVLDELIYLDQQMELLIKILKEQGISPEKMENKWIEARASTLGILTSCTHRIKKLRLVPTEDDLEDVHIQLVAQNFFNLTHLDLHGCIKITDTALKNLPNLQNLTKLYLRSTISRPKITDIGLEYVSNLHNLTRLHISSSGITDAGLKYISNLHNLTDLHLDSSKITDNGLKYLPQSLTILDCWGCHKIGDTGLKHISNLHNLTDLSLGWCKGITDAGLKYIPHLQNLTYLRLGDCRVTDAGIQSLSKLKKLTTLHLDSCSKVTRDGRVRLQQSLPRLKINPVLVLPEGIRLKGKELKRLLKSQK